MIDLNTMHTPQHRSEGHWPGQNATFLPLRSTSEQAIFLKEARGLRRILISDIVYLEAEGNYVEIHLTHGRIVQRNSMSEILKSLPQGVFCMVNRSQAVNIQLLDGIITDEVILGNKSLTLTKRYRLDLLQQLNIISGR